MMQGMSSSAAQVMAEVRATDWSRFSIPAQNYLWDYDASRVVQPSSGSLRWVESSRVVYDGSPVSVSSRT